MIVGFRAHGQGKSLYGDGLGIWYTKERAEEGNVFGNRNKFNGMGVFLDSYSNTLQGHQEYISVMIGDGVQEYDHNNDGGDVKIAGCPINFRGTENPAYIRIVYQQKLLRVYVDINDRGWEVGCCHSRAAAAFPKG